MPSVSEFKQECAALGLSHIEVVQGDREPDVTLDMIKNGEVDTITTGTYEYYESELRKLDIVFFSEDDIIQGVTFIGNSVFFAESNSDESWTYKTHNISIPVDGGIRTYSGAIKDEFIANGVMGIMADSIDDVDLLTGEYLENSLYGKIQDKINALKVSAGKTETDTIEGLKIPWLYSLMAFRDKEHNSSITGRCISDTLGGMESNAKKLYIRCIYCEPYMFSTNSYSYCWKTLYNQNDAQGNPPYDYTKLIGSISKYSLRTGMTYQGTKNSRVNEGYLLAYYGVYSDHKYISHYTYGGYNNPEYQGTEYVTERAGIDVLPINITKFKTQPYIYGTVFWIREVGTYNNISYLGGFLTIVGIDQYGKVIQPEIPYKATEVLTLTNGTTVANQQINFEITPQELETYLGNGIEYMEDWSELSPLKGKSLFRIYAPITAAEYNYALNLDYIIAPEQYVPKDYFDD